jgi:hypothetical protein
MAALANELGGLVGALHGLYSNDCRMAVVAGNLPPVEFGKQAERRVPSGAAPFGPSS